MTGPPPVAGRLPISAVIITRDAERHLAAVLAACDCCAERLVLDSGSTDGTEQIARAAGARFERQPFLGYGPQKRRAVQLAAHDWILALDADEVLDQEARTALTGVDLSDPAACWQFRRRTFVGRREIRHGPWAYARVLRLFNRTTAAFKPLAVHEEVEASRPPVLLPGSILHFSYDGLVDVLARSLRYAPLKADVMRRKGKRPAAWKLPLRGAAAFLQSYVAKGGWRDGAAGVVIAVARVIDSTLTRAIEDAGLSAPAQVAIALDVAATQL
ncbi:MAG: glycosyltransferase, partial [Planctomycetia bacterium]